jgi:hypothetical protein
VFAGAAAPSQILRHSQIAMTMEVYSEVLTAKTRSALKRLGGNSMARVAVQTPERADLVLEISP